MPITSMRRLESFRFDFEKAEALLKVKNYEERKLARNVSLFARGEQDNIYVRLYATDIIIFKPDNKTIILNSGGWKTKTTKAIMNKLIPQNVVVGTHKGVWYVAVKDKGTIEFKDNMEVTYHGNCEFFSR